MIKKVCPICGKEFEVTESRNSLGKGKYCSLECYNKIHYKDITNKKFNKLTALELKYKKQNYDKNNKKSGNREYWLCKCDCGNEVIVEKFHLVHGQIKSCGCLKGGKLTHGLTNTRIYKIWGDMKNRCTNPKNTAFKYYGARDITVCKEWQKFEPFYEWAINSGYNEQLTIERIDVNGSYEPNNCTWIAQKEQANNKRNNHFITYKGEIHTISEWANLYNINYKMLFKRLKDGWDFEKAINTQKLTPSEAGKKQKTKKVYCNEINILFNNANEAENYFLKTRGKKISGVSRSCKSSYLKAGGYKWYYFHEPKNF